MRRARLGHFQAFLGFSLLSVALATSIGCEPDLDSLSASYGKASSDGGSAGKGGAGGTGAAGNKGGSSTGGTDMGEGDGELPASCFDGKRSSDESDVDCGGTGKCPRCGLNAVCTANSDCEVGFCKANRCTEPTCDDKVKNQDETDVDCGGSCAQRCEDGKDCRQNKDCESGFCDDGRCRTHCESEKKDGDETGVDCGGPTCDKCPVGQGCKSNSDCETDLCLNKVCVEPSCTDGILNGGETDLDCGGDCSPAKLCALGKNCEKRSDCDSFVCTDNKCVPDDPYEPEHVLDTLEDGDFNIPEIDGRKSNWYVFGDGTGTITFNVQLIEGTELTRGSASQFAMHAKGTGFTSWGAGVGFDLKQVNGAKTAYDASAYKGITFWARSASTMQLRVALADAYTESTLHICDAAPETEVECDLHLGATVTLKPEWNKYTVMFSPLQPDGSSSHTELWVDQLVSIQFRFSGIPDAEYWIDDVIFIPATPEP